MYPPTTPRALNLTFQTSYFKNINDKNFIEVQVHVGYIFRHWGSKHYKENPAKIISNSTKEWKTTCAQKVVFFHLTNAY